MPGAQVLRPPVGDTVDMDDSNALGEFLKSRRSRMSPEVAGMPVVSRRRVDGLRREEVAARAGVSVEYYARLEQGRAANPSEGILTALAQALTLDEIETRHLTDLAHQPARSRRLKPSGTSAGVRSELANLLTLVSRVPAMIYNHRLDVLAWNTLITELFVDFAQLAPRDRNLARFGFLDPRSQERFVDWEDVQRATVGQLRLASGRYPDDAELATLIGELTMKSDFFRSCWSSRDVRLRTHGAKRFRHPLIGEVTLHLENFELPESPNQRHDLRLITFSAAQGSHELAALDVLGMWTTPSPDQPVTGRDSAAGRPSGVDPSHG